MRRYGRLQNPHGGRFTCYIVKLASVLSAIWMFGAHVNAAHAACPSIPCNSTGGNSCTIPSGTYTIPSTDPYPCTFSYPGKTVTLASGAVIKGDDIAEKCYTVTSTDLIVNGTLRAHNGCIIVNITGAYSMGSTGVVDVTNANATTGPDSTAEFQLTAGGSVSLSNTIDATGASGKAGGDISITGTTVSGSAAIHADGGSGGGGGPGGSITVTTTATSGMDLNIFLNGNISADGTGSPSGNYGGYITLEALGGATYGNASGTLKTMEAKGSGGYGGGEIDIIAHGGAAKVYGNLNANGNGSAWSPTSWGGYINVSGTSISTSSTWSVDGGTGGDGGSITALASGAIETTAGAMTANGGTSTYIGGYGGSIDVESSSSQITLSGNMTANGAGYNASGGDIVVDAHTTLTIQSSSTINSEVTGTNATFDGTIELSGCNVTLSGTVDTRNTSHSAGTNTLSYGGTFTANTGSSLLADPHVIIGGNSWGLNNIRCSCAGACTTCIHSPTLNGTVTPYPANIVPTTAVPACS